MTNEQLAEEFPERSVSKIAENGAENLIVRRAHEEIVCGGSSCRWTRNERYNPGPPLMNGPEIFNFTLCIVLNRVLALVRWILYRVRVRRFFSTPQLTLLPDCMAGTPMTVTPTGTERMAHGSGSCRGIVFYNDWFLLRSIYHNCALTKIGALACMHQAGDVNAGAARKVLAEAVEALGRQKPAALLDAFGEEILAVYQLPVRTANACARPTCWSE